MTKTVLNRLARAALLTAALALAAPAFAIDTGGGGTETSQPAAPAAKPKPAGPTLATARADIDAKNWTKAIADLRKIVAASPNSADAYNLLGYSYRNAGNTDRAGQAYVKALKLDLKNRARLAEQLLRTLEQPSKLELAELWTDEAIRRDDEMEQGIEKGRPAREVFRELRARVR